MSNKVCRLGVDKGDGSCGNVPNVAKTSSSTVYVNGIKVVRQTDVFEDHVATVPHTGRKVVSGSSTVYVEGLQIARVADPISCGAKIAEGSGNVYSG